MKVPVLFVLIIIAFNLVFGIANLLDKGDKLAAVPCIMIALVCALLWHKEIREYFRS